uniref:Uncharacterized protein n=1 Tax=Streptomyces sp. NBC_00003 TaxID=2903608 RepID=A0AAU2VFM0_9ACTN
MVQWVPDVPRMPERLGLWGAGVFHGEAGARVFVYGWAVWSGFGAAALGLGSVRSTGSVMVNFAHGDHSRS